MRGNASFNLFAALGLTAACLLPHQAAAIVVTGVTIDEFITPMTASVDADATTGSPYPSDYQSATNAPDAIGGQRGLYVEKTAGGGGERVRARINPSGEELLRMAIDDARGLVRIIWDGDAADQTINFSGLLGIDLTENSTNKLLAPFFQFDFSFSDVGGPVTLFVYQNGGGEDAFASGEVTVPGSIASGSSVLVDKYFDEFVVHGSTTLENIFTNVGAIVMEINATDIAQEGWDMRMAVLSVRGTEGPPIEVPVPATLLLLGTGLLGLRLARRAR